MGLLLGTVKKFNPEKGHIDISANEILSIGDTISLEKESGTYTISELMVGNSNIEESLPFQPVTIGRMKGNISVGDKVYKISSKSLSDFAKSSYDNCENKKIPLNCNITIKKNTPIKMKISTNKNTCYNELYSNICVEDVSNMITIDALKTPISVERVVK